MDIAVVFERAVPEIVAATDLRFVADEIRHEGDDIDVALYRGVARLLEHMPMLANEPIEPLPLFHSQPLAESSPHRPATRR